VKINSLIRILDTERKVKYGLRNDVNTMTNMLVRFLREIT